MMAALWDILQIILSAWFPIVQQGSIHLMYKKRTDVKFHIDFLTKGIRQSPYVSRRQWNGTSVFVSYRGFLFNTVLGTYSSFLPILITS